MAVNGGRKARKDGGGDQVFGVSITQPVFPGSSCVRLAQAVIELLDDLRDRICAQYRLQLIDLYREQHGLEDIDPPDPRTISVPTMISRSENRSFRTSKGAKPAPSFLNAEDRRRIYALSDRRLHHTQVGRMRCFLLLRE